jgi:hypothetical protein
MSYIVLEMFQNNRSFTDWWVCGGGCPLPAAMATRTVNSSVILMQRPNRLGLAPSPPRVHSCLWNLAFLFTPSQSIFSLLDLQFSVDWGHRPHSFRSHFYLFLTFLLLAKFNFLFKSFTTQLRSIDILHQVFFCRRGCPMHFRMVGKYSWLPPTRYQ